MTGIAELLNTSGVVVLRNEGAEPLPDGTRVFYLHAGHLHASATPTQITTILGSCVSVCLWDAEAGVGGMNHYMLPGDSGAEAATPRYANFAFNALLEQLQDMGAHRARLRARLYGGASIIASLHVGRHLGERNAEVGRAQLQRANIPIVDQDTGSNQGRKIIFSTATGLTIVKRV